MVRTVDQRWAVVARQCEQSRVLRCRSSEVEYDTTRGSAASVKGAIDRGRARDVKLSYLRGRGLEYSEGEGRESRVME
jgi:hypothetical protein